MFTIVPSSTTINCVTAITMSARLKFPGGGEILRSVSETAEIRVLMGIPQGWTWEGNPWSRRMDSMTQKAVLAVNTSAAASTPEYFSITGAAAASAHASTYPLTLAQ